MNEQRVQNESGEAAAERAFDFWLGSWRLSWPAEQTGGEAGRVSGGRNRIESLWDGRVIQENFTTEGGSFQGKSWTLYHAPSGEWRQTWVDNSGGYLLFSGGPGNGVMELRSAPVEKDGKTTVNRMVFRDISADALRWHWQRSDDGGDSWRDLWTIDYRRDRAESDPG